MLTVWSVLWGTKYDPREVYLLQQQVQRHLPMAHRFVCITDQHLPGIECLAPRCDYPGWWQKIGLFEPGRAPGLNLYLDLDVVIIDALDPLLLVHGAGSLSTPANWSQSWHGGIQSSVMIWRGDAARVVWDEFDPAIARWPPSNAPGHTWGDQEWISQLRDAGQIEWEPIDPTDVKSYKYHCREAGQPPPGASVIVFHGEPKPDQVTESWVSQARS